MKAGHPECQPGADGLRKLVAVIQQANLPDRNIDLAIYVTLWPASDMAEMTGRHPRGLEGREGYSWNINGGSVVYEKWTDDGRCPVNGGYPLPAYTASIDAAMTLVPGAHEWLIRNGKRADGDSRPYAHIWKLGENQGSEGISPEPAIALCLAALRARALAMPLERQKTHD